MEETAKSILDQVPDPVVVEPVMAKFPVLYEQSMNTVLLQEVGQGHVKVKTKSSQSRVKVIRKSSRS
jgi:dynein heavy chain